MRCLILLCACASPSSPAQPDATSDMSADAIDIVLDGLQPGWHVTTSRFVDHDAPQEATQISDGTPITLAGSPTDVFVATVTDATGHLVESHAMRSPCTMSAANQLRVPADFPTIQAAIDAAQPGQTVKVAPGSYTEALALRPGVCLLGSGARQTILDAHGAAMTLVDLTAAPGSAVSGFTLRGTVQDRDCREPLACAGDWYRAGIYIGGQAWEDPTRFAPPIITNNVFETNDIGVMFYWRSQAILRNNLFVTNRVGFVANHYQDRTLVANNVFFNNSELAIGNQAAYLDIVDNIIIGSQTAILFEYIQTGFIRCNIFWANAANQRDIYLAPPRFTIGSDGNVELDPKLVGGGDFHLQPSSPAKDAGCHRDVFEPDGTPPDLGVYGGPLAASIDL